MKVIKKPIEVEAHQWFKNGDHPDDGTEMFRHSDGTLHRCEGNIVRRFRRPDFPGDQPCRHESCQLSMHEHGWIDTEEGGHIVCPSDYIITGIHGERYPCKANIFEQSYDVVQEDGHTDAPGVYGLPERDQKDFAKIMQVVHQTALEHGWWQAIDPHTWEPNQVAVKLLMMHSEISEAVEEAREGRMAVWYLTDKKGESKPEGTVVELADAVIRIMDFCAFYGLDLLGALRQKSAYNDGREFRHGGKAL